MNRLVTIAVIGVALAAAIAPAAALAATGPDLRGTAASTCSALGHRITSRVGVSCTTAKRVFTRYLDGFASRSWSCSRSRHSCNGSGLSIDEYRYFRFS